MSIELSIANMTEAHVNHELSFIVSYWQYITSCVLCIMYSLMTRGRCAVARGCVICMGYGLFHGSLWAAWSSQAGVLIFSIIKNTNKRTWRRVKLLIERGGMISDIDIQFKLLNLKKLKLS
jgi:hypothetical protein